MSEKVQIDFVGKKIKEIRPMTDEELAFEGWDGDSPTTVIVLEDRTRLYPSRDDEGNGPGALFGRTGSKAFRVGGIF